MPDLFPGVLQFVGDSRLSLRGDLRGVGYSILQRLGYALQSLRHALSNAGHLPGALRLRRPIVCKSRRSSFIWPSSSTLFFCSWDVSNTSQTTSAATTITTPMSTPFILSPVHLRETVSLLYPESSAAESSRQNKKASPSRSPSVVQF